MSDPETDRRAWRSPPRLPWWLQFILGLAAFVVGLVLAANAQASIQVLAALGAVGLVVTGALRLASGRGAGRGWLQLEAPAVVHPRR